MDVYRLTNSPAVGECSWIVKVATICCMKGPNWSFTDHSSVQSNRIFVIVVVVCIELACSSDAEPCDDSLSDYCLNDGLCCMHFGQKQCV